MAIHNDLVEAYVGTFEDEVPPNEIETKIRSHTPKERLQVYLEWNGIIGYTGRIWSISQGEFES